MLLWQWLKNFPDLDLDPAASFCQLSYNTSHKVLHIYLHVLKTVIHHSQKSDVSHSKSFEYHFLSNLNV